MSDEFIEIFQNNDFVLLTETWLNELCDVSVQGYHLYQLNREDKKHNTKRDSGGIALYIRNELCHYCELVKKDSDDIIWLKINKSLLNLADDLYLCLCYIIPAGSTREGLTENNVLDRISDFIVQLANETNNCYNILICGDFNSRTGSEHDFVIFDNNDNIEVLPEDYVLDEYISRPSQDKIINTNGRKLLDFCKLNGLRICNGRIGEDKEIGKYTYVGSTGSSVVDYVLTNPTMLELINKFRVREPNILSDHCVVEFSISFEKDIISETEHYGETGPSERLNKKYYWDKSKRDQYILNLHEAESSFANLITNLTKAHLPVDIEQNIDIFSKLMCDMCDPFLQDTSEATRKIIVIQNN